MSPAGGRLAHLYVSGWRNTDTYTDGYSYSDGDSYTNAENCANTEASSHTSAETVVVYRYSKALSRSATTRCRMISVPLRTFALICPCTLPRQLAVGIDIASQESSRNSQNSVDTFSPIQVQEVPLLEPREMTTPETALIRLTACRRQHHSPQTSSNEKEIRFTIRIL